MHALKRSCHRSNAPEYPLNVNALSLSKTTRFISSDDAQQFFDTPQRENPALFWGLTKKGLRHRQSKGGARHLRVVPLAFSLISSN